MPSQERLYSDALIKMTPVKERYQSGKSALVKIQQSTTNVNQKVARAREERYRA